MKLLNLTIENFKGMGDEYFNTLEAKKPKIVVASGKALFDSERMRGYLANNGYRIVYPHTEVGKTLKENEYNGRVSVQFILEDMAI